MSRISKGWPWVFSSDKQLTHKEKSTQNKTEQTPWNLIFGEEKN